MCTQCEAKNEKWDTSDSTAKPRVHQLQSQECDIPNNVTAAIGLVKTLEQTLNITENYLYHSHILPKNLHSLLKPHQP